MLTIAADGGSQKSYNISYKNNISICNAIKKYISRVRFTHRLEHRPKEYPGGGYTMHCISAAGVVLNNRKIQILLLLVSDNPGEEFRTGAKWRLHEIRIRGVFRLSDLLAF